LHAGFTFDDAAAVVGYLAGLGASHLYCSPYLQAAAGSTHGYDVVDHSRLNEELGGAAGHGRLVEVLAEAGLGQVLDIVPNHMARDGGANRWWWDVLRNGESSRFSTYFDIEWPGPVLVPVLGDQYGRVLEAGEVEVMRDGGGGLVVRYHGHELPLSPSTVDGPPEIVDLAKLNADVDALDDLLQRQHFRLAHWRTANEELNYRRFFNIDTLVGLRIEDDAVFADTHRLVLDLVGDGVVDGLRIDHVDGLRDPEGYLRRLREATGDCYTVVEKILEPAEELPPTWPVEGTSGYDFVTRANNLFVDAGNERAMTACYERFTGDCASYEEVVHAAKLQIMDRELVAEMNRLGRLLADVCRDHRRHRDHTPRVRRDALRELIAGFGVYRTYAQPDGAITGEDRARVHEAVETARARRPDIDGELLTFLGQLLLLEHPGRAETEFALRLPQVSAPVMAKGVEDTAFYRYHRLISLNEVGGDPGVFGRPVGAFHDDTARSADHWPAAMLTLSTHDTKRSADVRARLHVLSEIPAAWEDAVQRWAAWNDRHRIGPWPDRNAEYLLYQTLVGAWPIDADRVSAFMAKATKEAKVHTSWTDPVPAYDDAIAAFVERVLRDGEFVDDLETFLAEQWVVERGRTISLAQTALLLTCPGVPDVYQGTELWDLSLVDPDNRRPVDYELRRRLLAELAGAGASEAMRWIDEGGPKLWLLIRLLDHRRRHPDLYESDHYEPLPVRGARSAHAVAFSRGSLLVVVPRLVAGLAGDWVDTTVVLPAGAWTDVLTGATHQGGPANVEELLGGFPVAVLAPPHT
jgi:(1->4)-alpha-D-glucan 1-alpha-D-glucosylmutase